MEQNLIILLAEDSDTDAFLLKRALRKAGLAATTIVVEDGLCAMDYLAGRGYYSDRNKFPLPHFAFFDLKMPRRNGFEALQWTREQPQFKDLPVMIISSSSEEPDIKRATALGANAYVVKTSNMQVLGDELKRFFFAWAEKAVQRYLAEKGAATVSPSQELRC